MDDVIDARKLSRDALEEKRRQAQQLRKRCMARKEIGEIIGVRTDTVGRWLKLGRRDLALNRGPSSASRVI